MTKYPSQMTVGRTIDLVVVCLDDARALAADLVAAADEIDLQAHDLDSTNTHGLQILALDERLEEVANRVLAIENAAYLPKEGWLAQVLTSLDKRLKTVETCSDDHGERLRDAEDKLAWIAGLMPSVLKHVMEPIVKRTLEGGK